MHKYFGTATMVALVFCLSGQLIAGQNNPCGKVSGQTDTDKKNVAAFCTKGIAKGVVTNAHGMESLLWLSVTREMADSMRADKLSTEQLVKVWMKGWRLTTERKSVTVYVMWKDVEIAKGDTTLFSGDVVTIK